jgi:tRNA (guanine-N7-)-methyltransferase
MLNDRFLGEVRRTLLPRAELRVVTDHDDYWAWMEEHFARWTAPQEDGSPAPFERIPFDRPPSAGEGEVVGTNFERKYRREGRPFHAATLRKVGP